MEKSLGTVSKRTFIKCLAQCRSSKIVLIFAQLKSDGS